MNPMGLSAPWAEYLKIIVLKPVKKLRWINPMDLSDPRDNYLDIIALHQVKLFAPDWTNVN